MVVLSDFFSYDSIVEGAKNLFNTRVKAYSVVLMILLTILITSLATRTDIETTILKVPGQLYQKTEHGTITNLYNIQFVNKTFEDMHIELKVLDIPEASIIKVGEGDQLLEANSLSEGVYFIELPKELVNETKMKLSVGVFVDGELKETTSTKFLGPISMNNEQ